MKNISIKYQKNKKIDMIEGKIILNGISVDRLWDVANHPHKFAPDCINLDYFKTDENIKEGNIVEEIHNFLGYKQRYEGNITSYKEKKEWSMSTKPIGFGPFPLPHYVKYVFEGDKNNSSMSIICHHESQGLLSLPIIRSIVNLIMKKAVYKLLLVPPRKLLNI